MNEHDLFLIGFLGWMAGILVYICIGVVVALMPVQHGKRPMEYNEQESLAHKAKQSDLMRNNGNRAFARARWKRLRRLEPSFTEWLDNQAVHARRERAVRKAMARG